MGLSGSAKHDLEEVKVLAGNGLKHYFSKTKAIDHVVKHLEVGIQEAKEFILSEIAILTSDNYSGRVIIHGSVYDIYGKRIHGIPWYIKFSILKDDDGEDYLSNISFHPTEKELQTKIERLEKYSP